MSINFGSELEYDYRFIDNDSLCQIVENAVKQYDPEHEVNADGDDDDSCVEWTCKEDESCGWEVTSPVFDSTPNSFKVLNNVLSYLEEFIDPKATEKHCGLHVHFSVPHFTETQISTAFKIFKAMEPSILKIWPGRTHSEYVRSLRSLNCDRLLHNHCNYDDEKAYDHYLAVNINRFKERGSIEVRYAKGTTNTQDIINWVKLLLCIFEIAKHNKITVAKSKTIVPLCSLIMKYSTHDKSLERCKEKLVKWMKEKAKNPNKVLNKYNIYKAARILKKEVGRWPTECVGNGYNCNLNCDNCVKGQIGLFHKDEFKCGAQRVAA
jgi:hypothetical protein